MVKAIYYTRDTEKKVLLQNDTTSENTGTLQLKALRITCNLQNPWLTPSFKVWPIIVKYSIEKTPRYSYFKLKDTFQFSSELEWWIIFLSQLHFGQTHDS